MTNMTEEAIWISLNPDYIYSGRVLKEEPDTLGSDYLWVYIRHSVNDGKTIQIQSTADYPVKMELRLTEPQADALHRCLHNALQRMAGKEP